MADAAALYIGRPCRHGHDGTRYKRDGECRECKRKHRRRWKRSESGKKYARDWAKKKYVAHPLPKKPPLTPEQRRARNRRYYMNAAPKARKRYDANMTHLRRYGMTKADYLAMSEAQGNRCAICEAPPKAKKRQRLLCVDHDHATGKVRGLLCDNCNKALGCLHDDQSIIFKALLYLRRAQNG